MRKYIRKRFVPSWELFFPSARSASDLISGCACGTNCGHEVTSDMRACVYQTRVNRQTVNVRQAPPRTAARADTQTNGKTQTRTGDIGHLNKYWPIGQEKGHTSNARVLSDVMACGTRAYRWAQNATLDRVKCQVHTEKPPCRANSQPNTVSTQHHYHSKKGT